MLFEQSIANYLSLQPYEYINTEIAEDGKHRLLHLKSSKEALLEFLWEKRFLRNS